MGREKGNYFLGRYDISFPNKYCIDCSLRPRRNLTLTRGLVPSAAQATWIAGHD